MRLIDVAYQIFLKNGHPISILRPFQSRGALSACFGMVSSIVVGLHNEPHLDELGQIQLDVSTESNAGGRCLNARPRHRHLARSLRHRGSGGASP